MCTVLHAFVHILCKSSLHRFVVRYIRKRKVLSIATDTEDAFLRNRKKHISLHLVANLLQTRSQIYLNI